MGNLLFSPSGRIGPSQFMKGMMTLAGISAVISLTGLISFQISQLLGLVSLLLIVPLFFILVKRSHDAGRSGWISIVWFILWLVIFMVVNMVVSQIMPGAAQAEMKTAIEALALEGGGLADIMAMSKEFGAAVAKEAAIPGAISGLLSTGIAAFLINMFNKHDAHDNQYGPEAGTA